MDWIWWVGAALLLAVVEMLSLNLVLIMLAGGALVAGLLSAVGASLAVQIVGFAAASALLLFALRPWMLRHLRDRGPLVETNAAAQVGRLAVAVTEITERTGRIKLFGEVWSARTIDDEVVPQGRDVRVVTIQGATAIVTAHHDTAPPPLSPDVEPVSRPHEPNPRTTEETAL